MSDEHKCPNCGAFPIERPGPLEAKLAEAQRKLSCGHHNSLDDSYGGCRLCQYTQIVAELDSENAGLETKLAEAQAAHLAEHRRHLAAVKAGVELCQERDALKAALAEAQIQITYEQERNRNNVGMADEEIGRVKAALEQARETLAECVKELQAYLAWKSGRLAGYSRNPTGCI